MALSKALSSVVFLGIVAIVAGRIAFTGNDVESMKRVRPGKQNFRGRQNIPMKINVREHDPPYEFDHENALQAELDLPVAEPRPRMMGAQRCETAPQWEGRATEWDHLEGLNNRFNITFDGKNRRKRIMEDRHAQLPGKRIYEYIMMYDDDFQYVINHNYNTCRIEKLGTWRNHTIPENATLEDYYEIGGPKTGFMVQEWSDRIPGRTREAWIGTFSDPGCWPITEIFVERFPNHTMAQSVTTRFFDLTLGIRDPSVFNPPSYCPPPPQSTPVTASSREPEPSEAAARPDPPVREENDRPLSLSDIASRLRDELTRNVPDGERVNDEIDRVVESLSRGRVNKEARRVLKRLPFRI